MMYDALSTESHMKQQRKLLAWFSFLAQFSLNSIILKHLLLLTASISTARAAVSDNTKPGAAFGTKKQVWLRTYHTHKQCLTPPVFVAVGVNSAQDACASARLF